MNRRPHACASGAVGLVLFACTPPVEAVPSAPSLSAPSRAPLAEVIVGTRPPSESTPGAARREPPSGAAPAPASEVHPALAEVAQTIALVGETERVVQRQAFLKVVEAHPELVRVLRFVPEHRSEDDKRIIGTRLFGVRADNLAGLLGFQNGDRIEQVNGTPVVDKAVYGKLVQMLRDAPLLQVLGLRRGKPLRLEYRLR